MVKLDHALTVMAQFILNTVDWYITLNEGFKLGPAVCSILCAATILPVSKPIV